MVWLTIAIPALTVVAGFVTLWMRKASGAQRMSRPLLR